MMLGFGDASTCNVVAAEPGFVCPQMGMMQPGGNLTMGTPAPPPVPTGALDPSGVLLDANGNPVETPEQAQALVDALATQEFVLTQGNVNTTAGVPPPTPSTPFCGAGSSRWISGVDNCVALGIGAAVFLVFAASMGSGRRRR